MSKCCCPKCGDIADVKFDNNTITVLCKCTNNPENNKIEMLKEINSIIENTKSAVGDLTALRDRIKLI